MPDYDEHVRGRVPQGSTEPVALHLVCLGDRQPLRLRVYLLVSPEWRSSVLDHPSALVQIFESHMQHVGLLVTGGPCTLLLGINRLVHRLPVGDVGMRRQFLETCLGRLAPAGLYRDDRRHAAGLPAGRPYLLDHVSFQEAVPAG